MYVDDMDDIFILSMEYLASHRCERHFRSIQLTVGRRVSLKTVDNEGLQVTARSTTLIPTRSEMLPP